MKYLIYTEDGKPTDETIALIDSLKLKVDDSISYRSEQSPQLEVADVVYSNSKKITKIYGETVKPIDAVKTKKRGC